MSIRFCAWLRHTADCMLSARVSCYKAAEVIMAVTAARVVLHFGIDSASQTFEHFTGVSHNGRNKNLMVPRERQERVGQAEPVGVAVCITTRSAG